jgi:hypothetical protein
MGIFTTQSPAGARLGLSGAAAAAAPHNRAKAKKVASRIIKSPTHKSPNGRAYKNFNDLMRRCQWRRAIDALPANPI